MIDIIIILACSMCGFALGKCALIRVKCKSEFYDDLERYLTLLKINIEGRQVELSVFDRDFATNCSNIFAEYLATRKLKCSVSSIQRNNLNNFFSNLDCSCSQQLTKHLECYNMIFTSDISVARDEAKKGSIYPKLGILLGVMVGIILI